MVLPVPELTEFVTRWRRRVDARPPVGVPAHITVLYPFLDPADLGEGRPRLEGLLAEMPPFEFRLVDIGWFGDEVVYLVPEPTEPFARLTGGVSSMWPELVPYRGAYDQVVPHLTLAVGGDRSAMLEVAEAATSLLPMTCEATEVWVMRGTPSPPRWQVTDRLTLGR